MSRKIVSVFLGFLIILLCIFPTVALDVEIVGKPEIIHQSVSDSFVRLALSDPHYLVMSQYQPGVNEAGIVYLYNISSGELSIVPAATSFSKAVVANGTVFFRQSDGFYSYSPVSDTLTKLNVSIEPILTGFVTDGVHFITMWGDYWPRNLTFTLYDLRTGDRKQIYPGGYPDPNGPMMLSGNYFVYSDSGMLVSDPSKRYLYAYNISSGETVTLPKEEGYSQYLCNMWGDTIVYELYCLAENAYPDPPERRILNLITQETESLVLPDGMHPSQVYPPYALMPWWDESSGITTVKCVEIDLPLVVRSSPVPPATEQTLFPETTQTTFPIGMFVGLIAVVSACVRSDLRRKK